MSGWKPNLLSQFLMRGFAVNLQVTWEIDGSAAGGDLGLEEFGEHGGE